MDERNELFLGLDSSTQSLKAVLIDSDLNLLSEESVIFGRELPEFKTFDAVVNIGGTPFIVLYPLRSGALPRAHLGVDFYLPWWIKGEEAATTAESAAPDEA